MTAIQLRTMGPDDWDEVAELICDSTNAWYQAHGRPPSFTGPKDNARLFCSVYEQLDPGCCVVAEDCDAGRLAGSCFYHPRPTHVSLGIMNAHPDYFGQGVARRLLKYITDFADQQGKPVRLVSSTLNLDSFSLYNRAGFVPRLVYQDMTMKVPDEGLDAEPPCGGNVRDATPDDVVVMADLEMAINHIRREDDYRHFVENPDGIWHVSVLEDDKGGLDGFLVSLAHPAMRMLGPGIARSGQQAAALIHAELNRHRGCQPVWLVPSQCDELVRTMYDWGAVNCEMHFAQARGAWEAPSGIVMPTFMPETG
ncbi:MAG: GNAT family N-acetyltransferase [Pirellulaceae bacterium]|nr:GNAT family N-acetyltransferase [Pirellulaceae bacterium]